MHIGIFGNHPTLKPGFESAMSLNQIAAFTKAGFEVTLYLGFEGVSDLAEALNKVKLLDLNKLEKFGLNFSIKAITHSEAYDVDLSALIWQSYTATEEVFFPQKRTFQVTKSFPRMLDKPSESSAQTLMFALDKFDKVAFSCTQDYELALEMAPEKKDLYAFVPRGFSAEWLQSKKGGIPIIACDAAVYADDDGTASAQYMNDLFSILREKGVDFQVSATRGCAPLVNADIQIPLLPLMEYYKDFISPAWVYLPCNFRHSIHSKFKTEDNLGNTIYLGLFENQMVEFQMSGAIVFSQKHDLDSNIFFDKEFCELNDIEDVELLADKVITAINNFEEMSSQAQNYTMENYSHNSMADAWCELLNIK